MRGPVARRLTVLCSCALFVSGTTLSTALMVNGQERARAAANSASPADVLLASGSGFPICHGSASPAATIAAIRLAQARTEVPQAEMTAATPASDFADRDAPLWDGLGSVSYKITTTNACGAGLFRPRIAAHLCVQPSRRRSAPFARRSGSTRHALCASGARRWCSARTSICLSQDDAVRARIRGFAQGARSGKRCKPAGTSADCGAFAERYVPAGNADRGVRSMRHMPRP